MLQGTFETLSLPEVLGLLASARKSGALWLEAGSASGVVHVEDGHCRAVETPDRRGPVDHGPELLERLVDVCFNAVRADGGAFRFGADEPAPWRCPEPVELSDALVEVERLLKQWREVVRLIPSLDCRPRLLDALVVDELVLDRDRWSMMVALDGRRTVRDIVERVGRPTLDVCQALLELVDAGAVGIVEPDTVSADVEPDVERDVEPDVVRAEPAPLEPLAPAPVAPVAPAPVRPPEPVPVPTPVPEPVHASEPAPEPTPEPTPAPVERPVFQPPTRPAPAAHVEPAPPAEPSAQEPASESVGATAGADRGTFLRMFSGLRDG